MTTAILRRRALHAATLSALLLPAVVAGSAHAQACPEPSALIGSLAEPLATVRYLADDALEGRLAGSEGERCAADYIAARFRALGLRPAGVDGTWFQDVPLGSAMNPHAPPGTGRNVLALLPGSDPRLQEEVIVVGAHHDHLGHGAFGSLATEDEKGRIHNGADDNASGVAAMLHVAAELARRPLARSVLFVAFTGEESGLLGSAHFTREATIPLSAIRAMLNLDMVGRLEGRPLIVHGVETAAEWRGKLEAAASKLGLDLALQGEGFGPSDHTSFYLVDIPVLHFFTNTHGDYHRPGDDWDRIDAGGLERVAGLVTAMVEQLAAPDLQLTLQRGAGQPPRAGGQGGARAWLGTVPDFAGVPHGVLLGGVTDGSPAEAAGLRRGDVLIRVGDHEIGDLEALQSALTTLRPGDEVELVVLRDGAEFRTRATLGRRGG